MWGQATTPKHTLPPLTKAWDWYYQVLGNLSVLGLDFFLELKASDLFEEELTISLTSEFRRNDLFWWLLSCSSPYPTPRMCSLPSSALLVAPGDWLLHVHLLACQVASSSIWPMGGPGEKRVGREWGQCVCSNLCMSVAHIYSCANDSKLQPLPSSP